VVFPREKNIKEPICCFCLCQLLLLEILVVEFTIRLPIQRYCVRDSVWSDLHKDVVLKTCNGKTRTKVLRIQDGVIYTQEYL
jgi:hypothetical protein